MFEHEHKHRIDKLWREFPRGGITDSLEAIEQITFLMYARFLDILETRDERRRERDGTTFPPRFRENEQELRWSRFRQLEAELMLPLVRDRAFAHLRASIASGEAVAAVMQDARLTIREPDLLANTVDMIDCMPLDDAAVGGDLYEYLLGKLAYTGLNGQYPTPRRVVRLMVDMIAPNSEDAICDPACGTGVLLVESIKHCRSSHDSPELANGVVRASSTDAVGEAEQGEPLFNLRDGNGRLKRQFPATGIRKSAALSMRGTNGQSGVVAAKSSNGDSDRLTKISRRRDGSVPLSSEVPSPETDVVSAQSDLMIYGNDVGASPKRFARSELSDKNIGGVEPFWTRDRSVHPSICYGFDTDPSMLRFAAMNLMLQGVHAPELHYQNTLGTGFEDRFPNLSSESYDVIFANPPFNLERDLKDVHPVLLRQASSRFTDSLILSLTLRMLKQGGRAAVVVRDRVLSELGTGQRLRKELVDSNSLDAVVALPGGISAPYRKISTAIVLFCKGGRTDDVFFIDAENFGFPSDKGHDFAGMDAFTECRERWRNRDPIKDRDRASDAFYISGKEIRDAEYDLSVHRYKEIAYEPENFDPPRKILGLMHELEQDIARDLSKLDGMLR